VDNDEYAIHDDGIMFDRIDQALDEFVHELSIARCLNCPEVANDVHDLDVKDNCSTDNLDLHGNCCDNLVYGNGSCEDLAASVNPKFEKMPERVDECDNLVYGNGSCEELAAHTSTQSFEDSGALDLGVILGLVENFEGDFSGCGDIFLSELVLAFCSKLRAHVLYGPLSLLPLPACFWQSSVSNWICQFAKTLSDELRRASATEHRQELFDGFVRLYVANFLALMQENARKLDLC
jgi:hypothetical protein